MLKKIAGFLKTRIRRSSRPQPHAVKEAAIKKYGKRYHIHTFVETGTYFGEMVEAVKDSFDTIYSIELNEELYRKAKEKFAHDGNVTILQGDSGAVLPSLLNTITEPVLFWLDGHYSGGITSKGKLNTPIENELEAIFDHPNKNHIILIDDARLFTGADDYPSYSKIETIAKKHGYSTRKEKDIIVMLRP